MTPGHRALLLRKTLPYGFSESGSEWITVKFIYKVSNCLTGNRDKLTLSGPEGLWNQSLRRGLAGSSDHHLGNLQVWTEIPQKSPLLCPNSRSSVLGATITVICPTLRYWLFKWELKSHKVLVPHCGPDIWSQVKRETSSLVYLKCWPSPCPSSTYGWWRSLVSLPQPQPSPPSCWYLLRDFKPRLFQPEDCAPVHGWGDLQNSIVVV